MTNKIAVAAIVVEVVVVIVIIVVVVIEVVIKVVVEIIVELVVIQQPCRLVIGTGDVERIAGELQTVEQIRRRERETYTGRGLEEM